MVSVHCGRITPIILYQENLKLLTGAGLGVLLAVSTAAMRRAEQSCLTMSLTGGSQTPDACACAS